PRARFDPAAGPARRRRQLPRSLRARRAAGRERPAGGAAGCGRARGRGLRDHRDRPLQRGLRTGRAARPRDRGHAQRAGAAAEAERRGVRVAVIGTGYVGLVVGACLAETGNDVMCADVDAAKIDGLKRGRIPIYEPALEPLVARNHREGRLEFTTDVGVAVEQSDIVFIAVGTPPDEDGSADLQHVLDVARTIGAHMNRAKTVATKSTVPVGTAERVRAEIARQDRKSTRLNSSHGSISYAVFCLK